MKELTYEQALKELEKTVETLESGEASLDDSIALFEKGIKLADYCNAKLNTAQQKFTELSSKNRGE